MTADVTRLFEPSDDELVRALELERGNVSGAAERLGVESAWLRRKIVSTKALEEAMDEIMERSVDKAIAIMRDGLDEESYLIRFYAAKEFLRSDAGRKRGFGTPREPVQVESGGGRAVIVLKWLGDDQPEPKTFEATQIEGPSE